MRKNTERNEALIQRHKDFPDLSYFQLGWSFDISRQRVGKIHKDTPHTHHKRFLSRLGNFLIDWVIEFDYRGK